MRALTLTQPWAWLVVNGHKPVENRRWHLWRAMLGVEVLIHASARMSRVDYEDVVDLAAEIDPRIVLPAFGDIELGGIVGSVRFTGCLCPPVASGALAFAAKEDLTRIEVTPEERARIQALMNDPPPPTKALEDLFRGDASGTSVRPETHPWWFRDQHGFTLEAARPVPFVACKGSLGFWEVPADILAQVQR